MFRDYTSAIKDMYNWAKTQVRTVGGDLEHFSVLMGLQQGSTLIRFLFALVMDGLHDISKVRCLGYVICSWYSTYDETRIEVNVRPEVWRQILESRRFRLSRIIIEYLRCKYSDVMQEVGIKVRLDAQPIPKKGNFKYLGSLIQGIGISMMMLHIILVRGGQSRGLPLEFCAISMFHRNLKGKFSRMLVRMTMFYGAEYWPVKNSHV